MSRFGRHMSDLRRDAGLTLRGLARAVPIDPGHLSRIEAGQREPTPELALAIDIALNAGGRLAALAPKPDLIDQAAHESERLAALLVADGPPAVRDDIAAGADRLAVAYLGNPAPVMLKQATDLRRTAAQALRRTRRPGPANDLTLSIGYLSGVMAYAALDIGNVQAALAHAEAAWSAAEAAGDNALRAWVRGTQSLIARFAGRYVPALRWAQDGLRYANGPGTARLRLLCGIAQSAANLGDPAEARRALADAETAREHVTGTDQLGGLFAFSEAKQAYYSGSALIWLDKPQDAQRARDEAERAISMWSGAGSEERSLDDEALAHVYAGTAYLQLHQLEAATAALEPILGLPEDRRISWIQKRLDRVADLLTGAPYTDEPLAIETRERIADYR